MTIQQPQSKPKASAPHAASTGSFQVAALVWRREPFGLQLLLVTSLTSGRWVLPKGWSESGETGDEAAAREAWEEAGVIATKPGTQVGTFSYAKKRQGGRLQPITVEVHALAAQGMAENWPERHRRRQVWVSPAAAATMVEESELADLILEFGRDFQAREAPRQA